MAFSKYLRERPFLVVKHHMIPAAGQQTNQKNFRENGKWNINESIVVVDRVTNKHLLESSVIVDILKRELVKNRFVEKDSDKEVIAHYMKQYNDEIADGIRVWMGKRTSDKKEAEKLVKDLEDELAGIEIEVKKD